MTKRTPNVLHAGLPHKPLQRVGIYQPLHTRLFPFLKKKGKGGSGASERQLVGLIEALAMHFDYKGQVYVGPGDAEIPPACARLVASPARSLSSMQVDISEQILATQAVYDAQIETIRQIAGSGGIDLIHAHWSYSEARLVAGLQNVSEEQGIPLLVTRYTLCPMHADVQGQTWKEYNAPYAGRLAQVTMCDITQSASRNNPYGSNYVVETGVAPDFMKYRLPATTAREHLFFAGDITPGKGVHYAATLAHLTHLPLKIVGSISDQKYWESTVEPLVDGQMVQYLGLQPQTTLMQLLAKAKAFVALYAWSENAPTVAQEALCMGVPVIATSEGGLQDIVTHGSTGFLITVPEYVGCERDIRIDPPAEFDRILMEAAGYLGQLDQLLPAKEIRKRSIPRYTFRRVAKGYDTIYRTILGWY